MFLTDFEIQYPQCSYSQEESLKWIARLHCDAEGSGSLQFKEKINNLISLVCCKKRIDFRYFVADQFCKTNWGAGFGTRSRFYMDYVDGVFEKFYPEGSDSPDDIIHVTCTGYNSPSAAQKLISRKKWNEKTLVTHAYHMGCMAAMPAIRIASGFSKLGRKKVDIVHTELCSLHFNPHLHNAEQLVAQSLFADGLVKYSLVPKLDKSGFEIVTIYEEIVPGTEEKMKWECEDWGLKMALSKDIPKLLSDYIQNYMSSLEKKVNGSLKNAYYAIHPGGPKIIDMIQSKLNLKSLQIEASEKIFSRHGNMSSATVPVIWKEILSDPNVPPGSAIVGLAFGPGLCICGSVIRKVEI